MKWIEFKNQFGCRVVIRANTVTAYSIASDGACYIVTEFCDATESYKVTAPDADRVFAELEEWRKQQEAATPNIDKQLKAQALIALMNAEIATMRIVAAAAERDNARGGWDCDYLSQHYDCEVALVKYREEFDALMGAIEKEEQLQ